MSHILIVDDEAAISWSLREVLQDEGHSVEVAASVAEALEICVRITPEVMLLDVRLPGRDGLESLPDFRALLPAARIIVMTAFISPFRREREMARELIGPDSFIEVYVSTSLEVCEQRDVKGLYKQARAGKLPNMTGINSPYELPEKPDYTIDTDILSMSHSTALLAKKLL